MARALAIVGYLAVLLAVDTQVGAGGQLVLGGCTWIALALACRSASPSLRAQALVVVVVATCAEIVGSLIWGVYTYRLENLPSFVPPAARARLPRGRLARRRREQQTVTRAARSRRARAGAGLGNRRHHGVAPVGRRRRARRGAARGLPASRPGARDLRRRLPRRRLARALRDRDRHLALGGRDSRNVRLAGQPAERRRLRLRVVRHRRARGRAEGGRASSTQSGRDASGR